MDHKLSENKHTPLHALFALQKWPHCSVSVKTKGMGKNVWKANGTRKKHQTTHACTHAHTPQPQRHLYMTQYNCFGRATAMQEEQKRKILLFL